MPSELRFEGGGRSAALKLSVSPRARVMRLRVDRRTGDVVLTVPRRVSQKKALDWAAGHRSWVEAQLARIGEAQPLGPGSAIPLFGLPHAVDWDTARPRTPRAEGQRILAGGPLEGLEARLTRWL